MISYDKLFALLGYKKINRTELGKLAGISTATLSKLNKNEIVTTDTLNKVCKALNCKIEDIIEYNEEKESEEDE